MWHDLVSQLARVLIILISGVYMGHVIKFPVTWGKAVVFVTFGNRPRKRERETIMEPVVFFL